MSNFIAHRGLNSTEYKENTKKAILDSLKRDYIKGIEIDVRITKDNKIVVIHDASINRTSNGYGLVSNMTLKKLKRYNFGTNKNPSQISTLNDILKIMPKEKIIIIEIKHNIREDSDNFINYFYKIVKKYKNLNIYISSFNSQIIASLKTLDSNLRCAVFSSKIINSEHKGNNYDFTIISSYSVNIKENYKTPIFIWAIYNKKQYLNLTNDFKKNAFYIVDYPFKFLE